MNFNPSNERQVVSIELLRMENIFSEIRDNALVGRAVGSSLDIPTAWNIDINQSGSGSIQSSYITSSSVTPVNYPLASWDSPDRNFIHSLECEDFLGQRSSTGSIRLTITGSQLGITD